MSAYSASAPVSASTIAPMAASSDQPPRPAMKCAACSGFSAARIAGWRAICTTPVSARVANQSTITGPKAAPTARVPRRWTTNKPTSTTTDSGST